MQEIPIQLRRLSAHAQVPQYQTPGAAAFDLHACLENGPLVIGPGERVLVPTGLAVWIGDPQIALHVMARSGTALKHGIGLANDVGLIDSDYQGPLGVLLQNRSSLDFVVRHGDRIAQAVVVYVARASFTEVEDFGVNTVRGAGGFGSTGT